MGASTPGLGLGMRHAAHPVPDGNAVAWILLPGGSSEAGRQRLALLHPVPLRPGFREVGDGEGSRVSHHRLIGRTLSTTTSRSCMPGLYSQRPRPRHPLRPAEVIVSDGLIHDGIAMPELVTPHGSETVKPLLLPETERSEERKRAEKLRKVPLDSRAVSDVFMLAMGAYTPLDGFMGHADWRGSCLDMKLTNGVFWPIPITLPVSKDLAAGIRAGDAVTALAQ